MGKSPMSRWLRWFRRKERAAKRLSENPEKAALTADRAEAKARRVGKLRQTWDDLNVLIRLVRAWSRGQYKDVSRTTLVLVLGAVVYFVSPIDAILDGIPGIGFIDDAAIVAWVLSEVRAEIDAFRTWELQARPAAPALPAAGETEKA
jgi:uncharacterized membrane protein YkvA (DUF1232 family)